MNGGSRYMCGREPAGQLPTSSTISERAASTHGSSKVAVGRGRTQARHVGGCGPGGGHSSDQTRGRWSKLSQKAIGGRTSSGRSSAQVGNASGSGTSGGSTSSCSSPSTSPTDHTMASSTGRPSWLMATRCASTVRPDRSGVTTRSTGANDATER